MGGSAMAHDAAHSELFSKINACTVAVNILTAEVQTLKKSMADETERYVMLLHKAQDRQFKIAGGLVLVILFCIGIIGYGAIGQRGMYTVRNTLPSGGDDHAVSDLQFIPPNDRHMYQLGVKPKKTGGAQ